MKAKKEPTTAQAMDRIARNMGRIADSLEHIEMILRNVTFTSSSHSDPKARYLRVLAEHE